MYSGMLCEIVIILLINNITYMEKEPKQEQLKPMFCESVEKQIAELEQEGWEYDLSFHTGITEQWNNACDRVEKMNADGFWDPILVQGQNELERKDGVAYIYKRKTDKYRQYEKDMGYT